MQFSQDFCNIHGLFAIKNFKANLLKRDSNTGVFLVVNFAQFLRSPVLKNIYKWSQKSWILRKKINKQNKQTNKLTKNNRFYNSHIYNVYVMFYYEIPWFYQIFKSENLYFLNLYPVHAAKILNLSLEVMLNPLKWWTKHLYNSKGFSFMPRQI